MPSASLKIRSRTNCFRYLNKVIPKEALGVLLLTLGIKSSLHSDLLPLTKAVDKAVTSEWYYLIFCLFLVSSTFPAIFSVNHQPTVFFSKIASRATHCSLFVGFALLAIPMLLLESPPIQPITMAYAAILAIVPSWVLYAVSSIQRDEWVREEGIILRILCYQSLLILPILIHKHSFM